MKTDAELAALARQCAAGDLHPDIGDWFHELTALEQNVVLMLTVHEIQNRPRYRKPSQRKAQTLLRTWLTPEQRESLKRKQQFIVIGSIGGRYRLMPRMGRTAKIERHGTRDFETATYCLHDDASELPPADLTLAHYLMIVTDEADFLAQANEHKNSMLWNSEWLRRLAASRRERKRLAEQAA